MNLWLVYLVLFGASALLGFLLTWAQKRRSQWPVSAGHELCVRRLSGPVTATLQRVRNGCWEVEGGHLAPGERVIVEAPLGGGVIRGRCRVLSADGHTAMIEAPAGGRVQERRASQRRVIDEPASLNGFPARVLNLSRGGALVECAAVLSVGDSAVVEIGGDRHPAWVLEVRPDCGARLIFGDQ